MEQPLEALSDRVSELTRGRVAAPLAKKRICGTTSIGSEPRDLKNRIETWLCRKSRGKEKPCWSTEVGDTTAERMEIESDAGHFFYAPRGEKFRFETQISS